LGRCRPQSKFEQPWNKALCKLATYEMPWNEASCKYELMDGIGIV